MLYSRGNMNLSPDDILSYLSESPEPLTKRQIAEAFGVTGDERIALKDILRDLEKSGRIVKQPGQVYGLPGRLERTVVIEITALDPDGDLLARPAEPGQDIEERARIEVAPPRKGHHDLKPGSRALARVMHVSGRIYRAEIIRAVDAPEARILGLLMRTPRGYRLKPTDRKVKFELEIPAHDLMNAREGDICVAEVQPSRNLDVRKGRILQVLGREDDPRIISPMAMQAAGIRPDFPAAVIKEAEGMGIPALGDREDLRAVPLVTIDGIDARDFDDAVFAEKDGAGFHLIVAIADVSYYVQPGTPLDREAYRRGNSTYFPDMVVPMLPEKLSNDLCSLRPHENRATLAVHLWIDENGTLKRYKFARGLMRSVARLTYEQAQAARDGMVDETTRPLMDSVIAPLYAAYDVLWKARARRGALDLDLPERKIVVDEKNRMTGVKLRDRLDSHKLIEEFMILANVAAAQGLEDKKAPCVYRVHERPDPERLESVREFLDAFGLSLPKGNVREPAQINQILHKAATTPHSAIISEVILRTQSQARYDPENDGHFGLALRRYAHFTSPIRRYADLLVHRSLVRAYGFGVGGLDEGEALRLEEMALHISETERRSMEAERAAVDRFTTLFLSERRGARFSARIAGVTRFGLFVRVDEGGADGIIPMRSLPHDYYDHIEAQHALVGRHTGRLYRLGARLDVVLVEAEVATGSLVFSTADEFGADIPGLNMPAPRLPPRDRRDRPGKNAARHGKGGHKGGYKEGRGGGRKSGPRGKRP